MMLEDLRDEEIVNKVGGRFRLSTLIQKRLIQLQRGSRALVNVEAHDKIHIVLQEIMQDKILLNTDNEVTVFDQLPLSDGPELGSLDM
jgi:DNA-directed RNA polymerase subunit omega